MAIVPGGNTRLVWVPSLPDVEAPTAAQLREGEDLTQCVDYENVRIAWRDPERPTLSDLNEGIDLTEFTAATSRFTEEWAGAMQDAYVRFAERLGPALAEIDSQPDLLTRIDHLLSADQARCDADQEFDASGLPRET